MKKQQQEQEQQSQVRLDMENGGASGPEAVLANDPAYLVGSELIASVVRELGVSSEEAAAMLLTGEKGYMPGGAEAVMAAAAKALAGMQASGEIGEEVNQYLEDEEFIKLLCQVPARAAVMVYRAQKSAGGEREKGERDAVEKLRAGRALPRSERAAAPGYAEMDFMKMSSAQFNAIKRKLQREAGRA